MQRLLLILMSFPIETVGSRTDSRDHFLCIAKKTNQKKLFFISVAGILPLSRERHMFSGHRFIAAEIA